MQPQRKHDDADDGKEPSSCRPKRRCLRTLPSKDKPGNRSVTIGRSTQVPDELGLFAAKDIEDEAVVCYKNVIKTMINDSGGTQKVVQ